MSSAASTILDKARHQAQLYASKQLHNTAAFWADKALSLSAGDASDLVLLASSLHSSGQHRRAVHALLSSPHLPRSSGLRYLAAKCYVSLQEWEEALLVLRTTDDEEEGEGEGSRGGGGGGDEWKDSVPCPTLGDVTAASLVVQGRAHEGIGSLQDAAACFKEALKVDIYCSEALDWLTEHHSLTADDEKSLLSDLPFKKQCSTEEEKMVKALYFTKVRHVNTGDIRAVCSKNETLKNLTSNSDVVYSTARRLYNIRNVHACYEITSAELQKDPFHPSMLLLHIACCLEKGKSAELFSLGHKLVSNSPSSPLAWYTVSCYYISIKNHQNARKYLSKVLNLDGNFPPAHLAFGVSFATEGEHDQAISAFSKAARIMKGSSVPLMQLGHEYYITGSTTTAVKFMKTALAISPSNPALLNEAGTMLSDTGHYEKAAKYLTHALNCLKSADPHMTLKDWEPIYNNLGHVYRRLNKLDQSLKMHFQALSLSPKEASTLTAIAFVYLLQEEYESSIEYCSQSLQVRREDYVTIEILRAASEQLAFAPLKLGVNESESMESLEPENEILEWEQLSRSRDNNMQTC